MESATSSLLGYLVTMLLLKLVLTSEQFTVRSSKSHQVVMVGKEAEFSCQLSPPQSAQRMKVGWFRDHHSQLVYLYEEGKEHSGESSQDYMNRTVFLKDALGEGKVTLRIYNVSVFDGGQYHCFFKADDAYEEAIMDLRVAALGSEIQINIEVPKTGGFIVECNSGGWFPQAQMEWKDIRGNVIPHLLKSSSQDRAGLLYLKMSVLLENNTHGPVTCCFYNPVNDQEKRASIVIPVAQNIRRVFLKKLLKCLSFLKDILKLLFECLPFLIYIGIFPVYLQFRNGAFDNSPREL
ncbi:Selection and upkeep of intraepithelial T-cells protein 7 [Tupaia chinensis]|uniref:Selection and upkeep of intraepithelial T-cells protein 7 n=1 Tax=Tupaia chinensis TaxID=246437 RepID=L9KW87_TUPCH|nr:Selection and upkeep of intraepithelial T-cells protein 7 [Tupaia chinensis]